MRGDGGESFIGERQRGSRCNAKVGAAPGKARGCKREFLRREIDPRECGARAARFQRNEKLSVTAADVAPGDDVNSAGVEALIACEKPPAGVTAEQQAKAAIKLEFYGERPWLFMRYELKAGQRRLAVNWAPVVRLHAAGNASRP